MGARAGAPLTAGPGEINGAPVDRFTLGHALVGYLYGVAGLSVPLAFALAVAWELAERPLKRAHPEAFPHASQDSVPNALLDVVAVMVGYAVANR